MSVFAAPDTRVLELNQRARLLRHAAGVIGVFNADLSEKVDEVAVAVAAEAMMIVPHRTVEQVDPGGAL